MAGEWQSDFLESLGTRHGGCDGHENVDTDADVPIVFFHREGEVKLLISTETVIKAIDHLFV